MLRRIVLLCHFIKKLFVVGNVISRLNHMRKYLCYCRPKSLNVWGFFPFHLFDAGCIFFILWKRFRFCSDLHQMSSDAGMNLFKEILPRVRKIFSNATVSDDHALLNLMLKEDMISKEYHQALLHEKDGGDLTRKVPLTFVEK